MAHAIASAFSTSTTLSEAVPKLLEGIGAAGRFAAGQYWERDRGRDLLAYVVNWRAPTTVIPEFEAASRERTFRPGEGLPGRVLATGEPALSPDLSADPDFPRAWAAGSRLGSGAAFPLGDQEVVGVLEFFRVEKDLDAAEVARIGDLLAAHGVEFFRRVRAQAAARAAEARRAAILEAALDAIVSMDAQGRVTDWNAAAERMFGHSRAEALGADMADLIIPARYREAHRRGLAHYLATGEGPALGRRLELSARRKEGTEVPVELTILPIPLDGEKAFTGYVRDMTERVQARERQQQQDAFRERFIGILGHDLRTPLQAILGSTALLQRRHKDEVIRRAVERIDSAANRMGRMISDLLDLARGRLGGGIPIARVQGELRTIAEHVIDEMRVAHPGRRIELLINGDTRGGWDADRVAQVVSNLVANALAHGDPEGTVRVSVEGHAEDAVIAVHNRGEPIAPSALPALFDPFRQGQTEADGPRTGVGLGLYIAREIAIAHGGDIEVQSTAEQGTTFTVRLAKGGR